mmetsp:Transcript_101921/g.287627  ORF Transcript_101921/g.287627 Transcript_101921/m.287627 type:complete len:330 (-) Transcript_101921:271-1260(-)
MPRPPPAKTQSQSCVAAALEPASMLATAAAERKSPMERSTPSAHRAAAATSPLKISSTLAVPSAHFDDSASAPPTGVAPCLLACAAPLCSQPNGPNASWVSVIAAPKPPRRRFREDWLEPPCGATAVSGRLAMTTATYGSAPFATSSCARLIAAAAESLTSSSLSLAVSTAAAPLRGWAEGLLGDANASMAVGAALGVQDCGKQGAAPCADNASHGVQACRSVGTAKSCPVAWRRTHVWPSREPSTRRFMGSRCGMSLAVQSESSSTWSSFGADTIRSLRSRSRKLKSSHLPPFCSNFSGPSFAGEPPRGLSTTKPVRSTNSPFRRRPI